MEVTIRTNYFLSAPEDAGALAEAIAVLDGAERDLRLLVPDPAAPLADEQLTSVVEIGRRVSEARRTLQALVSQESPWILLARGKWGYADSQRQIQELQQE